MSDMTFECEMSFNIAGVTFPQKSNKMLIVSTYGSELGLWFPAMCSKYNVQSWGKKNKKKQYDSNTFTFH